MDARSLLGFAVLIAQVCCASAASLATTTTTVASAPNPTTYGESVTFTVTVSSAAGTPTGTVELYTGATMIGAGSLSGGRAQLTTTFMAQGAHNITAVYGGDGDYAPSTSAPLVHTVNPGSREPTSVSLLSSLNPSSLGAAVTFTATVFSFEGTPGGNLRFMDGAAALASVTLSNRRATFTTSTLPAGSRSITAVYEGDSNYVGSVSPVLTQVVIPPPRKPTSTSVTSSPNPSPSGQAVSFTATVTGSGGTPTGGVRFTDGGQWIGDAVLAGGRASIVVEGLAVGGHAITVRYGGDDHFAESASPEFMHVVSAQTMSPTSTVLASSRNPSVLGQNVTFVATVTAGSGTATGSVQFYNGALLLGSGSLNSGRALLSTSALDTGSHSVTAVYGGDGHRLGSTSAPLTQVVNATPGAPTSTSMAASATQTTAGQEVSFTATVSGGSGTPTGSLQFLDGGAVLGAVSLAGGQARLTTSSLAPGIHFIRATYTGDSNFAGSTSSTVQLTVLPADSRPLLGSSSNPSMRGQPVTFEAQLAPMCEGTVSFMNGQTWLGAVALGQGGRARFTASGLAVGLHRVTAVYAGGAVCPAAASGVLEQMVQPAGTSTVISVAAAPSGASGAFVLTAVTQVLAPGTGAPTGEVIFRNGETVLGGANLSQAGVATLAVRLNPAPPLAIDAQYIGNAEFASSTSVRLTDLTNLAKPDFEAAYIVNAASFAPGLSPGAFATIFGSRLSGGVTAASTLPYPTAVQGVQVTLNGSPVQLVYLSDQQINFLVPSNVTEGTATVIVSTPQGTSNAVTVPLVAASPGIFADHVSGYGAILVHGTAETTLTRPVRRGEYIEIYGTGLGAVDASNLTVLPVTVNLGPLRLAASHSGLNPVYPGLYQVNVQIPEGLTGEQKVSIETNSRRSNEVKIKIQ